MRFVTPVLAVLAILAVAANFWLDVRRAAREIAPLTTPSPALAGRIAGEAIRFPVENVTKSVFLVVFEGIDSIPAFDTGTAFLVDAKCGIFATNAHVAELYDGKTRLLLRQPGSPAEYEVTAVKIHPAFTMMREKFDAVGPVLRFKRSAKGGNFDNAIPWLQFDTALLYVQTNPGAAECKLPDGAELPPALKLASQKTVAAVKAGDPVAAVGFPGTGHFNSDTMPLNAQPRIDFGTVRGLGSGLPSAVRAAPRDPALDTLIFHSAATIGGSSGSPILNPSGEVIAVHARGAAGSGNGRLYQEGAAESIQAVVDMLEGDDAKAAEAYGAAIDERLGGYAQIVQFAAAMAYDHVAGVAKNLGMRETVDETAVSAVRFDGAGSDGCLTAQGPCLSPDRLTGQIAKRGSFTVFDLDLDTAKANIVGLVDFDLDVNLPGGSDAARKKFSTQTGIGFVCPTLLLEFAQGANASDISVARESDFETFPSLVVPARHKGVQKVKFVAFRPDFCSSGYARAQAVVTPFALAPGPRAEDVNVSVLDQIESAVAQAVESFGDAVSPDDWRKEDGSHNELK